MTPEQVIRSIVRFQDARPEFRKGFQESAIEQALELANERDELVSKMEVRWRWCMANDVSWHQEREDILIADIATYAAMEDALALAARELLA